MEEELEKKPSSLVTLCRWSSVVLDGQETNDLAPKGSPAKLNAALIKSERNGEAGWNGNGNGNGNGNDTAAAAAGGSADDVNGTNGVQGTNGAGGATGAGNADDQHQNQFQSSQNCSSMEVRGESEDCYLIPKGQLLG